MNPAVTVCLRVFGRPARTRRILNCLAEQTMTNFELLAIGDRCPQFQDLIRSDWFDDWRRKFKIRGNHLFFMNCSNPHMQPDWGAYVTNVGIKIARGPYFMFLDNDDIILPQHVKYYHHSIHNMAAAIPPPDFVYNNVMVCTGGLNGNKQVRESHLAHGHVGHGELIVRTDFLRRMPPHQPVYGQDWRLIQEMMVRGRGIKGHEPEPTYYVMSTPGAPEQGMENDI